MAATLGYATNLPEAKPYDDRQWEYVFLTKSPEFEADHNLELYQRAGFIFQAMMGAKSMVISKVGAGS